ncbi:MAG: hypothetical protein ACP5IV_00450 [Caldisericia bacterium]
MEIKNFEEICEIGHGGEATVYIQLRNSFPFFEKNFRTKRDFIVSFRVLHKGDVSSNELLFNKSFNEFLRHLIAKKFDDYFLRKGFYRYPHISRLLGFDKDGYYYEFVYGLEGYYPLYFDDEFMNWNPVVLYDEKISSSLFHEVGIFLFQDIIEPTSNYVKNIIIEEIGISLMPEKISNLWKRIDFGVKSIKFDYEKIRNYIKKNERDLIEILSKERVEMLLLSLDFLLKKEGLNTFNEEKFERLKYLIELFLKSTFDHMGVIEENPESFFMFRKEKRYKKLKINFIKSKNKIENFEDQIFNKRIFENDNFIFELVLSSNIPSIDGVIITHSNVPIAKIFYKNKTSGIKVFLLYFLLKKFEDYFITKGYYSFPHIPRPIGFKENYILYEFPFGKQIVKKIFIEEKKVDDLEVFYNLLLNTGIDILKNITFFKDKINNEEFAYEFFVSQPEHTISNKISRMWQRGIFTDEDLLIDYDKIEKYLLKNKEDLNKNLTKGRYETMILAIRYLKGKLKKGEFDNLKKGILKFRISSLRHYTPKYVILVSDTLLTYFSTGIKHEL